MIGIYCRISKRKEDGKDVSIATQKEEGIKFASSINLGYRFFVDEGISGTKDEIEDRPGFAELFRAMEKDEITGVYCIDQSRLERNPKIWQLFQIAIIKNECKFYPNGIETDLNDPVTRMASGVISLANELYASLTSKKVKLAIYKNALSGKSHGLTAYGYQKDTKGYLEINKEQARVIKKIYQLSLKGTGCYTIANILNNEGMPTKFNSFQGEISREDEYTGTVTKFKKEDVRWRGNVIHDMIINPIYKGSRQWKNDDIKVPAIVDEELWEKVNKNLQNNKKFVGKKEEYNYLLNGLVYCKDCEREIRGKKRLKGNDNAYKCKGKSYPNSKCDNSRGISIPKLETFIITHLFISKDLKKHLSSIKINTDEVDGLNKQLTKNKSQLEGIEKRITKTYDLLLDPDFTDNERIKLEFKRLSKAKEDLSKTIEIIENKLLERTSNNRKKRFEKLINGYSSTLDFTNIKRLVLSLIECINIKHVKEKKGGYFLITIIYKGFDEATIYRTNWTAMDWYWIQRISIISNSDKKDLVSVSDKMIVLNNPIKSSDKSSKGFQKANPNSISILNYSKISLEKEELIMFD